MNCPFHVAIYRSQMRSYRDLPLRYSELGTVYRYERSGVLHGLLRVRGLTMDDGHLFVREDQIGDEIAGCMTLRARHAGAVRLQGLRPVSWRPARRASWASPAVWERAEAALRGGAGEDGPAVRGRRGRRRVLRPEDRPQDQGCARTRVAVLDVPARLPAPGARSSSSTSRPDGTPPAPDHDPPRAARVDGAVHRRPDRAVRGRVPAVAGAGPGAGADGQREGRGVRQRGRQLGCAPRGCGSRPTWPPTSWGPRSGGPSWRRFLTWWSWVKRTWRRASFRPGPGKGQQQPATPLDEFAVRLREEAKMPAFGSSAGRPALQ